MNEFRLEVGVHPVAFQKPPSDGDGFDRVIDAFGAHGYDLHTFAVPDVVRNSPSYGGGITFCGDLERHDPYQEWLLLSLRSSNTLPWFLYHGYWGLSTKPPNLEPPRLRSFSVSVEQE